MEKLFAGIKLAEENVPNWFVVVMGIGTVFVGLIAIVIICKIIGAFFIKSGEKEEAKPVPEVKAAPQIIENRQEIIAAVSAVLAEELGTDVSALRIHSFKKL